MQLDRRVALEAIIRLAAATEMELFHDKKTGPLAHILRAAREDAIKALASLVTIPFTDANMIRLAQNEVQRFIDLLSYTRKQLDVREAEDKLAEDDRIEMARVLEDEDSSGDDE